jgi:tetratricopeptide (TPR) repeat protein
LIYEKSRVEEAELKGQDLAEAYVDLGESYLLNEQYELALESLSLGYEIAQNYVDREKSMFPRALIGLAITYANLGRLEEAYFVIENMENQLKKLYCRDCRIEEEESYLLIDSEAPPLIGPDRISIGECVNRVVGTARRSRELISFVKKPEVQFILNNIIGDLEDRANRCCHAGGVWKACLGPLVNKWYKWNEKWKLFKIPPDPAWD